MSKVREAEVLEIPAHGDSDVAQARRIAQGRAAVERYVERLENAVERLKTGPEAAELYCALAELREGIIENDPVQVEALYKKALDSFALSHSANQGLRRHARSLANVDETIASLEAEINTAPASEIKSLQLELVRTWLYCAKDAEKAILILENIENADSDASTLIPESNDKFDAETFLLWEDALMATGAWDRYEGKLRQALRQQTDVGFMTQHIEERLWILYRYIMPDEDQAAMLCKGLMDQQPLDDELIQDATIRAQKENDYDTLVAVLKLALERLENSPRANYYRSLLANIAGYELDDREYALDLLDSSKYANDLTLLHQQICLLVESEKTNLLLDALTRTLEFVSTPLLRAEILYEIACILRDDMDQEEAAVVIFSEANKTCPTHEPTLEALADAYAEKEDWENLSKLYAIEISYAKEHQLVDYSPDVFVLKYARLASLYENKLHYALDAFNSYQAILRYRADDIAALKGAGRMTQQLGNWTELLQLYAAAQGCTQDMHENIFLLENIAKIADIYLNDADTACTALEELRSLEPKHDTTTPSLARLYIKLEKWDELIELTNEEIEQTSNPEYKATLLCRNAEIAEYKLSSLPQAVLYYEKARSISNSSRQAAAELERIYANQKAWEKLNELIKSQISLTTDTKLKGALLRRLAKLNYDQLDSVEDAVTAYETALRINPHDSVSRRFLLNHYRTNGNWDEVLRILNIELKDGGTYGAPWLTHLWNARIHLYKLKDETSALNEYEAAFKLNPNNLIIFRYWLALSLKLKNDSETLQVLKDILSSVTSEKAHDEIEFEIADLTLRQSHDPKTIEDLLTVYEKSNRFTGRGTRLVSSMLIAVKSASGCWSSRLALALHPRQSDEIHRHALMASVVLNIPEEIKQRSHEILCQLNDMELARKLWAMLPPAKRPDYRKIPAEILKHPSGAAQDLRRWAVICALLNGNVSDPTDRLLPDDRDENLSYRPDLELLAAYFERSENWEKLLEVLNVQEQTLNQQEIIQITLQKAWVLTKIQRPKEALESIRKACQQCQYSNPMRISLYDYLTREKDFDFLTEQIRLHLMNTEDAKEKSELWQRLAQIYQTGIQNLEEALRCLDNAYQEDDSNGQILCEISDTAQKIGELDIARRALDDYIRYHKPSLDEQLALEPKLLELHFKYSGGDVERILTYFEELSKKTGHRRDCQIILARAHAIAGNPQVAAQILLEVISYPIVEDDIDLWIILVDLYLDKLGQQTRGEQILWELFKVFPTNEYIFGRLNKLYQKPAERRIMVANLKQYVKECDTINTDPKLVQKYLGIAARILGSELGAWREAQELYTEAIGASKEVDEELVKNRAHARCRIPGEAKAAYREFCDLLVRDPFQPDIYKAAIEICRRSEARDRERILKQLATIFIPDAGLADDSSKPKLMDARQLNDDILIQKLVHPDIRKVLLILHEAMPILKNYISGVPRQTAIGSERVKNDSILQLFSTCSQAFSLGSVKLINSHDDAPTPVVLDDPNVFCISLEAWKDLPTDVLRHWAGYACGLLWTGVSRMIWSDPSEIWQLLDGIYCIVTGKGITNRDDFTQEAMDRLNSTFSVFQRGIRSNVAKMIDEVGPQNIPSSCALAWKDALIATADRTGLLFSGSLAASIPAILQAEGWSTRKSSSYLASRFKSSTRIPALIQFALSDDYLDLRYSAGLAMPKSTISG